MSDVVDAVGESFKRLVLEKPYRSITVKEICEDAFISRRTFYANFIDKRAVLAYLFRCDAVSPIRRAVELLSVDEAVAVAPDLLTRFYRGIYDNRDFYAGLVKPMRWVDATFTRVVTRGVSKLISDSVLKFNPHADKKLLAFTARYHADAIALLLEKWIFESYETPIDDLVERHIAVMMPSIVALVQGSGALPGSYLADGKTPGAGKPFNR